MTEKSPEPAGRFDLKRDLGIWSAAAIVVGTVIGSAIFIVPRDMINNVGSPLMVFAVWIFGGMLSLFGAAGNIDAHSSIASGIRMDLILCPP